MKKKIMKFIRRCFDNAFVKVLIYIVLVLIIFYFFGVFDSFDQSITEIFRRIFDIFTSEDTLSIFLAAIFSIAIARIVKRFDFYLEESSKISDNHHKVISTYNGHPKTDKSEIFGIDGNYCNKDGSFMALHNEHITVFRESELKNEVKDTYSKEYKIVQQDRDFFNHGKGKLYLPSLNVFSNVKGDTKIVFNDSKSFHQLPDFVMQNALNLLAAHKNSNRSNNSTVRLNDFSYDNGILTLDTQRSMYFHMLITNRCMDYEFDDGLTIRNVYEYSSKISPLHKSVLGNQIGINGLILTKDGYVLVEKRDHKKITWKNKFAQSISLALKVSDLKLDSSDIIGGTPEDANKKFKGIIQKTVKDNFGLIPEDYLEFSVEDNFLGIARDLLEGGKPNMYFYLTTKYTAKELTALLEKNAARSHTDIEKDIAPLQSSKFSSDYYLIPYEDIRVNFNYAMKVNRYSSFWIRRRIYPRETRFHSMQDKLRHSLGMVFNPVIKRECGEALLVTMAFLELCKERIDAIKNK